MAVPWEAIFSGGISLIGVIVWFVRLEGRVNYNEKVNEQRSEAKQAQIDAIKAQFTELRVKHDELDSKIVNELAKVREGLARIEGFLQRSKD